MVLHRRDRHDLTRLLDLIDPDLREADMADLPALAVLADRFEAALERRVRVEAMEVVEVDAVRPEPAQALLDLRAEDLRPAVPARIPPFVATTTVSGYGASADAIVCSLSPPV